MTIKKLILLILLANSTAVFGQKHIVGKMEFELFGGISSPVESYHGADPKIAQMAGVAYRYNIPNTNWDVGATFQMEIPSYDFLHDGNRNTFQKNRTITLQATCNYNFKQGKKINPFVGIGVGWANNEVIPSYKYVYTKGNTIGIVPKVGVEFLSCVRLTGYAQISRRGYNSIGASLGITVGGYRKK